MFWLATLTLACSQMERIRKSVKRDCKFIFLKGFVTVVALQSWLCPPSVKIVPAVLAKREVSHTSFLFTWPLTSRLPTGCPLKQPESQLERSHWNSFLQEQGTPYKPLCWAGRLWLAFVEHFACCHFMKLASRFWFGSILHPSGPYLVELIKPAR